MSNLVARMRKEVEESYQAMEALSSNLSGKNVTMNNNLDIFEESRKTLWKLYDTVAENEFDFFNKLGYAVHDFNSEIKAL